MSKLDKIVMVFIWPVEKIANFLTFIVFGFFEIIRNLIDQIKKKVSENAKNI